MRYMVDTNIIITAIRRNPKGEEKRKAVIDAIAAHLKDGISISSLTLAELFYGAEKSEYPKKNIQAIGKILSSFVILPFDDVAAEVYGEVRAELERKSLQIGSMDMLLAAHAKTEGLVFVTDNEREFSRVPGLSVESWAIDGTK